MLMIHQHKYVPYMLEVGHATRKICFNQSDLSHMPGSSKDGSLTQDLAV